MRTRGLGMIDGEEIPTTCHACGRRLAWVASPQLGGMNLLVHVWSGLLACRPGGGS